MSWDQPNQFSMTSSHPIITTVLLPQCNQSTSMVILHIDPQSSVSQEGQSSSSLYWSEKGLRIVQGHRVTEGQNLYFLGISLVLFENTRLETLILPPCSS